MELKQLTVLIRIKFLLSSGFDFIKDINWEVLREGGKVERRRNVSLQIATIIRTLKQFVLLSSLYHVD